MSIPEPRAKSRGQVRNNAKGGRDAVDVQSPVGSSIPEPRAKSRGQVRNNAKGGRDAVHVHSPVGTSIPEPRAKSRGQVSNNAKGRRDAVHVQSPVGSSGVGADSAPRPRSGLRDEGGRDAVHVQSPVGSSGVGADSAPRLRSGLREGDRRIAVGLFLIALITYAWFFSGGGWNQNAHFDLTRALVERQTLHIDGYRVNTGDVSWAPTSGEWHAYINKPPGISFLGAIAYAPFYFVERAMHLPLDSWTWMTINAWLVTLLTCGVTGALIPAVLYLYGVRCGSRVAALGVALAVAFGTGVFPYSTLMMAHVPPALFLLLAFVLLDERPLLAGICAGIAGVSHYLCIPAAIVMLIALAMRDRRAALRFALGGAPFGAALAAYHHVCFGSPFVTSVETSPNFTEEGLLFGVFRLPSLDAMWGLTFSEYRGLFFASPFLLLSFLGFRRMKRRDAVVIAIIVAIFFFVIAGFNGWHGGSAFGPRYLVPIVPLLAIPLLALRGRVLGGIALAFGVAAFGLHLLATAVDPTPQGSEHRPVRNYLLTAGRTSINEQAIDELLPHRHYTPGSHESTWASFNLGELLFGAGNPLSVLPIVVWVVGGSVWLWRRTA